MSFDSLLPSDNSEALNNSLDNFEISICPEATMPSVKQCQVWIKEDGISNFLPESGEEELDSMCHVCGIQFQSLKILSLHNKIVHPMIPKVSYQQPGVSTPLEGYHCYGCNENFTSLNEKDHESLDKCEQSFHNFQTANFIKHHQLVHKNQAFYQCPYCDCHSNQLGNLRYHIRAKHLMERTHECAECHYRANQQTQLLRHMSLCHEKRPFWCPFCGLRSSSADLLSSHLRNQHCNMEHMVFRCDSCHFITAHSADLKKHTADSHVEEKPFHCPFCELRCKRMSNLSRHINSKHATQYI